MGLNEPACSGLLPGCAAAWPLSFLSYRWDLAFLAFSAEALLVNGPLETGASADKGKPPPEAAWLRFDGSMEDGAETLAGSFARKAAEGARGFTEVVFMTNVLV